MNLLEFKPLTSELIPAALELDRLCFGGLWTVDGYQRELASPNSELLGLSITQAGELSIEGTLETGGEEEAGIRGDGSKGAIFPPISPSPRPPVPASSSPPPLIGIGCFWAILEEAHITLLAIHPDYQGRGLGTAMLHALLKAAANRHLERATLEVRVSNHQAISLYKKFGFREAGRRRRYYQDTNEDALILWRSGLQSPEFGQMLAKKEEEIGDRLSVQWVRAPAQQ